MKIKRKRNWWKIIFRSFIFIIILFIISCFVFDYFVQLRMTDKEFNKYFAEHNIKGSIHYYTAEGIKIRYVEMGNDSLPVVLFIHGSPSSSAIYSDYFEDKDMKATFKMYAVDRPGYGNSGLGKPEPSIEKQARIIRPILDSLNKVKKPVIVLAGSYGTSVACRLVMDNPGLVDGLVLVAPSIAPGEEKIYWFSPAIEQPVLNWFIPRMFQSANTEKLAHKEELTKMLPYWKNINIPVMYMQGDRDGLIYPSNAEFAKKQMINVPHLEVQMLPGEPHFLPYKKRPIVKKKLFELYHLLKK